MTTISIHAPRVGRDESGDLHFYCYTQFQSTRPVRGATIIDGGQGQTAPISIHAPRAGRDESGDLHFYCYTQFQSTRPVRGATAKVYRFSPTLLTKLPKNPRIFQFSHTPASKLYYITAFLSCIWGAMVPVFYGRFPIAPT